MYREKIELSERTLGQKISYEYVHKTTKYTHHRHIQASHKQLCDKCQQ